MGQIITPGDFHKKEPSRQDQINGSLFLNINQSNRMLALLQRQILGMAKYLKIDPKELARIWADDAGSMEYYQLVKTEQDLIIKEEGDKAMSDETQGEVAAPVETPVSTEGAAETPVSTETEAPATTETPAV